MDDFSFPLVADDQSVKLTITPSLWRISSLVFPEYNYCKEEEDDDMSTRYLRLRSSGSGAEEKMDTLWEGMNDYDFHSDHFVINQAVMQSSRTNKQESLKKVQSWRTNKPESLKKVQSSRTNKQESLKKSKINTVVIRVTKKLFSFGIMAGAKK
ncbi:hypothetical protein POM88_004649 [Heracleum sosnowskyi]|uniref:Uncharacterized protein n=1 Tax=Heracleum sosnowskyi TaxID=360622 RepID=A0AAD8JKB6_9APIA|nr:hypothetical protein POM88_004649 [Heracleum sosnowskyi]